MSIVGRKYYQVDINTSPARVQLGAITDGDLHEIDYEIKVFDGQAAVDCTGAQAAVYVVRADRQTVFWTAEAGKNGVKFRMPEAAHAVAGRFAVAVRMTLSGVKHTVFLAEGSVITTRTDTLVDPGHEVPDLDELLARIAEMEAKTAAASAAASTANAAAQYAIQTADAAAAGVDQKVADAVAPSIAVVNGMNDRVRQLEGTGKNHNARIANLEAAAKGYLYREDVDDATEYQKTVPEGAMPWASLDKVGAKTLVWNQLVPMHEPLKASGSVPFSNGTRIIESHKYLFVAEEKLEGDTTTYGGTFAIFARKNGATVNVFGDIPIDTQNGKTAFIKESPLSAQSVGTTNSGHEGNIWVYYYTYVGENKRYIDKFNIFDLTAMFGAGNEPTAEEFRAMFPADYYPYSEPTLMSFGADQVVSSSGQANDLSALVTKYFPDGMKSAGEVHDEIDLERGVAVKRIGSVDVSSFPKLILSENFYYFYDDENTFFMKDNDIDSKTVFIASDSNIRYVSFNLVNHQVRIYVYDATIEPTGQYAYILNHPIETPIDPADLAGLADLNVEAGGTITLTNQHGDDYRVPLPNQETYIIKLGGAAQ